MSQAELTRLEAMANLKSGDLTQLQAAVRLGISERQVRRLWRRFRSAGAAGLTSRRRGRPSNNRFDEQTLERALGLVAERYWDFGPTFANEKLREVHDLRIGTETLRQAMIRAQLWIPKLKRRRKIHPPRERRPQFGELIQIDGYPHDWFEGRAPRCSLIVFIDDATSKLINLQFVPAETTWAYLTTLRAAIECYGRPLALYSDKHSIFRAPNGLYTQAQTQFGRILAELDIELICAHSPQAKGRVERANSTLQRRLVRELRLRDICSMNDANAFLPDFINDYNARFAKCATSQVNAHRGVTGFDLNAIFSIRNRRRLSKDCTIQIQRVVYLVDDPNARGHQYIVLLERENGAFELLNENDGSTLACRRLHCLSEQGQIRTAKELNAHLDRQPIVNAKKSNWKPPQNHPWKTAPSCTPTALTEHR